MEGRTNWIKSEVCCLEVEHLLCLFDHQQCEKPKENNKQIEEPGGRYSEFNLFPDNTWLFSVVNLFILF